MSIVIIFSLSLGRSDSTGHFVVGCPRKFANRADGETHEPRRHVYSSEEDANRPVPPHGLRNLI